MASTLRDEIRQTQPFSSPQEEAYLNLLRTADAMADPFEAWFRDSGLSIARYNALRILRGAGRDGRTVSEVAERLVTRAPDVTRLLDGLVRKGLAERRRDERDRRVVRVFPTAAGKALLRRLQPELERRHREQLAHLSNTELRQLNRLLVKARQGAAHGVREPAVLT